MVFGRVNAPDDTASAESSLLLLSANQAVADRRKFQATAERIVNWNALIDAADHHGVAPLLHCALERMCPEAPRAEAMARLRALYRESEARGLVLSAALLAAQRALRGEGVAALPLKGPILAARLYADPAVRPFSDIDMLVHAADIPVALRALARLGYTLDRRLARVPVRTLLAVNSEVMLKRPDGASLDLHWEIAPRAYPFRFDPELLWRSVRTARLEGREIPDLAPEALLLFLCVHGAKHGWSRLIWLCDVATLLGTRVDCSSALDTAASVGCARPILLGLLLAHEILDTPVPAFALARARAERGFPGIVRAVRLRFARPHSEAEGLEDLVLNAHLAEHWRDAARHYAVLLAPSEAELRVLALPATLRLLYYPFRVARLATKYTMRIAGSPGAGLREGRARGA
jgi:hypothetical protein